MKMTLDSTHLSVAHIRQGLNQIEKVVVHPKGAYMASESMNINHAIRLINLL